MSPPPLSPLLLLLAVSSSALVTAASADVADVSSNATRPRVEYKCGDHFNFGFHGDSCFFCSNGGHKGLARQFGLSSGTFQDGMALAYRDMCYDRFSVSAAAVSLPTSSEFKESFAGVSTVRMRDLVREESAPSSLRDSRLVSGDVRLHFVFASSDARVQAERFVVWKKKGCETKELKYKFYVDDIHGRGSPAFCLVSDEGEIAIVVCEKMVAWVLTIHVNQPVTLCRIPAELEVYGTSK